MARDIYNIPHNFAEEGTIFNGKIKMRNAAEAVLIGILLLIPLWKLQVGFKVKIYIGIIVILPVLILAVVGIMGESLFSFILSFLTFIKKRRIIGEEGGNGRRSGRTKKEAKAGKGGRKTQKEKANRGGKKKEGGSKEKSQGD